MPTPAGTIYLIGAGPGDPGLITVRGKQRLAAADLVLYDYLVNPQLLDDAADHAELVCLGRHGKGRILSQDEIHERMISAASAGRTVARLQGGDTTIFARLGEEIAALEAAGIDYEVIPGVTAVQAASSCTGIPLTHRDHASCIALITGQQGLHAGGPELDFASLARFPGTLVFYMGVTTAPIWSQGLIREGKSADTPVAVIWRASLPGQQTILTTLGSVGAELARRRLRPPAIILVGETVSARATVDWFANRPLCGQTVLVTRPAGQAAEQVGHLLDLGADVLRQPAIEITPPADTTGLDRAIDGLADFDWIVFSSANGVRYFFEQLWHTGRDLRSLASLRIAAIGPATSAALAACQLRADLQPEHYRAEALAESLRSEAPARRFLLVRASRGREVLADELRQAGGDVTQVVAYESRDVERADAEVAQAMSEGRIHWTTVTSSAIARSLVRQFGEDLRRTKLAAISPLTAGVLAEMGFPASVVAEEFTSDGVVRSLLEANQIGGGLNVG